MSDFTITENKSNILCNMSHIICKMAPKISNIMDSIK